MLYLYRKEDRIFRLHASIIPSPSLVFFAPDLEREMKSKPINFRPVCDAEREDIARIHAMYKALKTYRDSSVLAIEPPLNIFDKAMHAMIVDSIKLTPYRAFVLQKEKQKHAEQQ